MVSSLSLFLSHSVLLLAVFSQNDLTCPYSESESNSPDCTNDNTDLSDTAGLDNVICQGAYGCYNSEIECNTKCRLNGFKTALSGDVSGKNIYCDGMSGAIFADVSARVNMYAYGDECLGESDKVTVGRPKSNAVRDQTLYAYGRMAAFDTNIFGPGTYGVANIGGYRAVYDSCITNFGTYNVDGAYAMENTVLYSGNNNLDVTINLKGYFSGSEAQIYCQATDTCNIVCKGYGCSELKIYYANTKDTNGNTVPNVNVDCDQNEADCTQYTLVYEENYATCKK